MKLWQKDATNTSQQIVDFTVGNDRQFDLLLAQHDVKGSLAHAAMLCATGIISEADHGTIEHTLHDILNDIQNGTFSIDEKQEDIHSQIESMLVERIGNSGKSIHTGRSRNDQVAVDIKLFLKAEIKEIKDLAITLFQTLQSLSNRYAHVLMPGYTHMQVAMPSSFGLWFGAYAESLTDDMEMLASAWAVVNKNPLGSGAGYGSSFPLDRKLTTSLLGFATLNYNSIYAQMTRGKSEKITAMAIANIAATLSRLSTDLCLYMNQNFGFITFPSHLTTGSSIMPHKKNPDVFELIRAKCNRIQATPNELTLLTTNLPSGYHRDMQLTKEILFPALSELKSCMAMMNSIIAEIQVNEHILDDEKYVYLFTVEKINELVNAGTPFRDAYRQVGNKVENGTFSYSGKVSHTHEGSIGNLCNEEIKDMMATVAAKIS
ncbi:MAG: argininosuccinate lyase [Flavipsychrobacter sp.]|nr:argininosuccinate lyase [Flavipsychrobacter sp.]